MTCYISLLLYRLLENFHLLPCLFPVKLKAVSPYIEKRKLLIIRFVQKLFCNSSECIIVMTGRSPPHKILRNAEIFCRLHSPAVCKPKILQGIDDPFVIFSKCIRTSPDNPSRFSLQTTSVLIKFLNQSFLRKMCGILMCNTMTGNFMSLV